jgi:hypothetical protein
MTTTSPLQEMPVGTCPACGESVFNSRETDGPVWTCPADLSDDNPYREQTEGITEEMMEKYGIYSNCWEDFGRSCYERMPLHGACYDKGNY